jgi:uncharacterized protein (DUF433 family)
MIGQRGTYTAGRAAALSGVPKSTVYRWARIGWCVPSVSRTRVKLWSYKDLLGLRAIHWLRHPRPSPADSEKLPPAPVPLIQAALVDLARINLDGLPDGHVSVRIDRSGSIHVGAVGNREPTGRSPSLDSLDLIEPFESRGGIRGPNLAAPRSLLRIVPGKLGGAPHLLRTRLQTEALAAIHRQGMTREGVYRLYPRFDPVAIDQALDLENQLTRNLHPATPHGV